MKRHEENILKVFARHKVLSAEKIVIIILYIVHVFKIEAACVSSCSSSLPLQLSYASCEDCTKYVTCLFGQMTTYTCWLGSVYDDTLNICSLFSGTCADYLQGTASTTTAATTAMITVPVPTQKSPIIGTTFAQSMYIKIFLVTTPCVTASTFYNSAPARSNTECGSLCNRDLQCWYFQFKDQSCLMYLSTLPPCNVDIYKYVG